MKIISDALSENTLKVVISEIKENLSGVGWSVSTLCWPPEIRIGNNVGVITRFMSNSAKEQIEEDIKNKIPDYENLVIQCFVWPPLSNISNHDDKVNDRKFAATIYLNESWDINFGGFFVWKCEESQDLRICKPSFNTMVLNDIFEQHLVTPVTTAATEPRVTLQIWAN